MRGALANVTNARWDAVDADGARRTRRMRTAKSCGSDVAVLALRSGEAKLLWDNGGKRAVLRGEHEVSRKAIAQGRPECSRCPVCSCAVFASANRTRDRGCSKHPVFPAPSDWKRAKRNSKLGRNASRDHGVTSDVRNRHCERSEAIHLAAERKNGLLRYARNDVDRPQRTGFPAGTADGHPPTRNRPPCEGSGQRKTIGRPNTPIKKANDRTTVRLFFCVPTFIEIAMT